MVVSLGMDFEWDPKKGKANIYSLVSRQETKGVRS